jgi:uncharacterized FlaG/YvyC family protein
VDSDIPTGNREAIDFSVETENFSTQKNETPEEIEKREVKEEREERVKQEAIDDMSDIYRQLHEDENNFVENGRVNTRNSDEVHEESSEDIDSSENKWANFGNKFQKELEKDDRSEENSKSSTSYPRPPVPVGSFSDNDDVYESDGTSQGNGDFPPMPPMMLLQK